MARIALAFALALSLAGIANSSYAGPNPAVDDGLRIASMNGGG